MLRIVKISCLSCSYEILHRTTPTMSDVVSLLFWIPLNRWLTKNIFPPCSILFTGGPKKTHKRPLRSKSTNQESSSDSSTIMALLHVIPLHSLQAGAHFNPAFLQEHLLPQPDLHEHLIIFMSNSGAAA